MPNSDSSPPNFCTVGVFVQKKGQERCNFENITDTWARHLSKTEGGEKYGGKSRLGMVNRDFSKGGDHTNHLDDDFCTVWELFFNDSF